MPSDLVQPFSALLPDARRRGGWADMFLGALKTPTEYRLRRDPDTGGTVLFARAQRSASAMMHPVHVKLVENHRIAWCWKVASLIEGADNTDRHAEDAPVRIVLAFGGDKTKLGFRDQMFFEQVRLFTGQEAPYATLMYIWENHQPVETVLNNPHTGRVRMLVAESGPQRTGRWLRYVRDIRADYIKAFGEEPGPLIGVGVLTDTDNTGQSVEAWYGDINIQTAGR